MPIYEYRCAGCGQYFEKTRPMSQSSEPAPCPHCSGEGKRVISAFAATSGYGIKVPEKEPFRPTDGGQSAG